MIRYRRHITFLYIFLFAGAFNDLLRLGGSQINLFRILLPFALLDTILLSTKARKAYLVGLVVAGISLVQSLIFTALNSAGVRFSIARYGEYFFYYLCIATVVGAVITLYECDPAVFRDGFVKYVMLVGVCYLLVFMAIYHTHYDYQGHFIVLNNPNDYGVMLVMILPVFYMQFRKKRRWYYLIFIPVAMVYLFLNDCKLALLGVAAQIMIAFYLEVRNRAVRYRKLLFLPAVILFALVILVMDALDVSINGYSFRETILEPIKAMFSGRLYPGSNTSVVFRTNVFIMGVQWLFRTLFLGIGFGNAGVLMRNVLGQHNLYGSMMLLDSISLHNAYLEFLLEFGVVFIIGVVLLIRRVWKVLKNAVLDHFQICFVTVVISGILWMLGPSGVLADYQIFAFLTFLLIGVREEKKA